MNASRLTGVSDAMIFQQPRVVPNVNALTDSAETALCAGDRAKGRLLLHGALSHFPNDPQALTLMAWLLEEDGQPEEGTQFLRRAVAADPRAERIFAFASHLKRHVSPEHAIEELQALPSAVRTRGQLGLVYASALAQVGRHAEEIATYRLMLKQDPQNPDIWLHLANALRSVHQTSDAIRAVKRAIQLRPTFGPAYWTLANLKTYSFTAEELSRMRDLVSRTLPLEDALALHFALGKAHEDAEQFATSFQHYATGNLLRAKTLDPSKVAITSKVDSLIAHCSREVFMRAADAGCPADDPIFIVGLHRSGSTLVEQILASHPLIEGTGELKAMHTLARRLQSFATHTFGETLARLSTSDLVSIGEEYLQNLSLIHI